MTFQTGDTAFDTVLWVGLIFAAITVLGAWAVKSPYGRFASNKMGISLNPKLGWWLMEIPATVVFLWFYFQGKNATELVPMIMAGIWILHYSNRGWFFPLSIRTVPGKKSTFGISVMLAGMFVTSIHGYLNARWFSDVGTHFTPDWLTDPRFIGGLIIYAAGLFVILQSESIMRNLRPKNTDNAAAMTEYKIPFGGMFRWVSSPQYLGELIAWTGFSILTWGVPGLIIFLISAGNLVPRAFATHKWYREKFSDYPAQRKAIVPFIA